ncbi:MAG: hypothetical protein GEV13_25720 [Rhodospirillales bacterium]|nr:hypothetical protein [Rhodospirillales bacterium]
MSDAIPDSLEKLVDDLLPWTSRMPTIKFYIYGSRVRGDHRSDSDIDICFDTDTAAACDVVELQIQETDDDFSLPAKYRSRIWDQSKRWGELRDKIRSAPVKYYKGNIICVDLPPVPKSAVSN